MEKWVRSVSADEGNGDVDLFLAPGLCLNDVVMKILCLLPGRELAQLSVVSRDWNALINQNQVWNRLVEGEFPGFFFCRTSLVARLSIQVLFFILFFSFSFQYEFDWKRAYKYVAELGRRPDPLALVHEVNLSSIFLFRSSPVFTSIRL